MRRARLVAAMLLVVAFATGGLTGMVAEEALGLDWFDFLDPDVRQAEALLLDGLDLSADQRSRIDGILGEQQERLEDYWRVRVPELQAIVEESYDGIRGVLTPGQRSRLDRRVESQGVQVPERD